MSPLQRSRPCSLADASTNKARAKTIYLDQIISRLMIKARAAKRK